MEKDLKELYDRFDTFEEVEQAYKKGEITAEEFTDLMEFFNVR